MLIDMSTRHGRHYTNKGLSISICICRCCKDIARLELRPQVPYDL